ncbi:HlyD family secretion protein [Methylobacterium currus]|uniref:HlyD family secretion protein n=1 Tax=Methylobacterium currus TaxID=2051553 RepID=A0A2R4WE46_9HYPH|nr:HlyD family secretion protein [Methylobacterium currus]AWB19791.1 HlyD family secretion protein [Methylobacterium currus]
MTRALAFLGRFAVTAAMLALAIIVGAALWDYYLEAPWTRDGRVRAEVVGVAPDVSGLVRDVEVRDNQRVKRGDVLFRIDPDRFALALRQAEAVVAGRKANLVQAEADLTRYRQLSDNVVSQQKLEATLAAEQSARAAYDQAVADRDLAKLNLDRSEVRASVNGRISNLELRPGAYVGVGKAVMALVDSDTLHVQGYFEETKLDRIHPGDPVTVRLMGEGRDVTGKVESVAAGIEDRERSAGSSLLANVNPTFAWVRLAQRVPVRITLDSTVDRDRLTVGRTATVVVHPSGERPEIRPFEGLRHLGLRDGWEALKANLSATKG